MSKYAYIANGSNTTVKTGAGNVQRLIVNGVTGATVVVADVLGLGATPNFPNIQAAVPSNIAVIGPIGATPQEFTIGAQFTVGLTIAATSNASVTVTYD